MPILVPLYVNNIECSFKIYIFQVITQKYIFRAESCRSKVRSQSKVMVEAGTVGLL